MPRGLEFGLETVRATIMREFWERGYEGTSLSDLERATSLVRTSLYNAFGNKPAMFLDSLKLYHAAIEAQIEAMTESRGSEALADAIGGLMVGRGRTLSQPAGCLMVMTATQTKAIAPGHLLLVRDYRKMLVDKAQQVLERDRQSGRLLPHIDPRGAAEFLICVLWGALAAQCLGEDTKPAVAGADMVRTTIQGWLRD